MRTGTFDLHRVRAAVLRTLAGLVLAVCAPVAVAHDAGNILFYEGDIGPRLFRINSAGTFTDDLTHPPGEYVDHSASWSPNGAFVAFERSLRWFRVSDSGLEPQHWDPTIIITDRLGQRERPLLKGILPVWSGNPTNKIAFGSLDTPDATKSECISIINPDGTGLQRLVCVGWPARDLCGEFQTCFSELRKLAWSRDGKFVVALVGTFVTRLSSPGPSDYWGYRLYAVEVATGRLFQLRSAVDPHEVNEPPSFVVAPNNTVYYDTIEWTSGVSTPAIYRVDLQTNALTRITTGSAPLVSTDGKRLVFTQRDGTNRYSRVFIANADGSAARQLGGATPGVEFVPLDWSPCNRILVLRKQGYNHSLRIATTGGVWRTLRENAGAEQGAWHTRN